MTNRKSIEVQVHNLRVICLGIVNFPPGEEGPQLALDLTKHWNPLLFRELGSASLDMKVTAFSASSVEEIMRLMNVQADNDYPDCSLILQFGKFQMLNRDTGKRAAVDVVLATFSKAEGDSSAVIVGDDLTIVPSSSGIKSMSTEEIVGKKSPEGWTERWSKEIQSTQKWADLKMVFGIIVILIGVLLLPHAYENWEGPLALIPFAVIVGSAIMLRRNSQNRKEAVARLTAEIQQTCREEGLDTKEVVEILYREISGNTRNEILREVNNDALVKIIDREYGEKMRSLNVPKVDFDKPSFSSTYPGNDFPAGLFKPAKGVESLGAVEVDNVIAKMTKAGDAKGLFSVFQLAESWDTRETVLVAMQIVARDEGKAFDREEMIEVLHEIKQACEASSDGGSYRLNCLDAANELLVKLGSD
jgi:hypothetical protein